VAALNFVNKRPLRLFVANMPRTRNSGVEGPALKKGARVLFLGRCTTSGKAIMEAKAALISKA
jgi:orotate phosphoribosyltransferase